MRVNNPLGWAWYQSMAHACHVEKGKKIVLILNYD